MCGRVYIMVLVMFLLSSIIFNLSYPMPNDNTVIYINIYVRKGYILVKNNIVFKNNVPRELTYSIDDFYKKKLLYASAFHKNIELNITFSQNNIKILNNNLYKNISLYMIFMDVFYLKGRRGNFSINIPLLPKEVSSASCLLKVLNNIKGNLTLINSTILLKRISDEEWIGNFSANNLNNFSISFSLYSYRGAWLWLICRNLTREIIIDNSNVAKFIDHLVIENIGNSRASKVLLKLLGGASLKSIKGFLCEYHEGSGLGKYIASKTNTSLNIELYLYSPPHRGEKAYLTIIYEVPLNKSDGENILNVFYNPNIFICSSKILIKTLGKSGIEGSTKHKTYSQNGYEVIEFLNRIPSCNDIPLSTCLELSVEINEFYKYRGYINMGVIIIAICLVAYLSHKAIGKRIERRVEKKIIEAETLPLLQKLHDEYLEKIELLEKVMDLKRKYFRGEVSRYIYRQNSRRYKMSIDSIDKKISDIAKSIEIKATPYKSTIEEVSKMIDELDNIIGEIVDVELEKRRGRLTSKEYESRIEELEKRYKRLKVRILDKISYFGEI